MMREKRRYILIMCTFEIAKGNEKAFEGGLYNAMQKELGNLYFKANPKVVKYIDERRFVLRVGLDGYKIAIASLAFIKVVNDTEVGLYTLGASGTIRALLKDTKKSH